MKINTIIFPDGQPHVKISDLSYENNLTWPIRNPTELMQLVQISNAMDAMFAKKTSLYIPYLMGARSDRHMETQDSCDLRVVADIINLCGWKLVELLDVHSEVALQLINRSINQSNRFLVQTYNKPNSVLICPDAGAVKKVDKYLEWNKNLVDVIYCIKNRDPVTGKVKLKVLDADLCTGRDCVIIDDICDGGATFNAIRNQIYPLNSTLMVTHGIFSKGIKALNTFGEIITTNSYKLTEGVTTVCVQ